MTQLLIVEDHAPTRQSLRQLLGDVGEIYECDDGAEAFSAYARHRPDWVLMDLKMKHKGGLAATREIIAAYPEARVVIVTLYGDAELREAAREAGACGYVVKDNLLELRGMAGGSAPRCRVNSYSEPTTTETTTVKHLSGPSNFWRCPNCRSILQKRESYGFGAAAVVGTVTCGGCSRTYSHSDVYGGRYDLPEVELHCPSCSTHLRGPQDDLLGKPCPACNRTPPYG